MIWFGSWVMRSSWGRMIWLRGWGMVRGGMTIGRFWVMVSWLVVSRRRGVVAWLLWWWVRLVVSLVTVAMGSSVMVAGADILIKDGSVWAVESVLLSVGMAQMVDLKHESQ